MPEHHQSDNGIPDALKEMIRTGLAILWRGFEYARNLNVDSRDFAVEREALYRAGLSAIDIRWLTTLGYIEAASKKNHNGSHRGLGYTQECEDNVSFVLTGTGTAFACEVLSHSLVHTSVADSCSKELLSQKATVEAQLPKQKPIWDRERKELRWGDLVIKHFRWSAVNQETILMAFEEDGWPARIDDPLPHKPNQDPKCRLHDTIKCLNRNHLMRLLRFSGDGTGEGILWTLASEKHL